MKSTGLIPLCSLLGALTTQVYAAAVTSSLPFPPPPPGFIMPQNNAAVTTPLRFPPPPPGFMLPNNAAAAVFVPPPPPPSPPPPPPAPICLCNGVPRPVVLRDVCLCGDCKKIQTTIDTYTDSCPDSKFYEFNKGIEANCQGIENTEDCEFFKKSPGDITDAYKRCRDDLDSIKDDCENCSGECSIVGQKEEKEEKEKDD